MKEEPIDQVKQEKERSVPYRLSLIFLAISAVLCIVFLWMIFFPTVVIKPNVQPYKVLTKNVIAGQRFVYQVDACKFMDVQAVVERQFVSDVIYTLPGSSGTVNRGCDVSNISITVPDDIPPGIYYLELSVTYRVNFLKDAIYHFRTEEFQVSTPSGEVR